MGMGIGELPHWDELEPSDDPAPGVTVGTDTPNIARVYDALLGGKDNLAADRLAADRIARAAPHAVAAVRHNRAFLRRAVRHLALTGIDQFLDLGSGLPTARNVHTVAAEVTPGARVIYVDNDPVVLAHARALLADDRHTFTLDADLRAPRIILDHELVRTHLDLTRPVAVLMVAVLHFLPDSDDPAGIVATFRDALAPGSCLALTHATEDEDVDRGARTRAGAAEYSRTTAPVMLRTREQVTGLFEGFRLVADDPTAVDTWRAPGQTRPEGPGLPVLAGVGVLDGTGSG